MPYSNLEKLTFFAPSMRGGGAERVVLNLANYFAVNNMRVDIILLKAEGPFLSKVNPMVNIVDFGVSRAVHSIPKLMSYLNKESPKAVISAMHYANVVLVAANKFVKSNTKIILSTHNLLSRSEKNRYIQKENIFPWLINYFYKDAYKVIAVSRGVACDLIESAKLPENLIQVIYNPINTGEIRAMAKLNLPKFINGECFPYILAAGRLNKYKSFDLLVRAFKLVTENLDIKLIIIGEGDLRSELELLILELNLENQVYLPGFIENPYPLMNQASAFVLSSSSEGFGNVLVEAMALGTPVVSTNCPSGPAEILENGKWGRLVPVGDVNSLATAIVETLNEPIHPTKLMDRAQYFSLENIGAKYSKIINTNS